MAPNNQRGKEKGSAGTRKARDLAPQESTHEFNFYLDDIASSHRRVMKEIEAALLEIPKSQAPKDKSGKPLFKRLNGKLYTPEGTLTFQIKVMPNKESPEEDVLRLLFRWIDLYFIGFGVKDTWYLFQDDGNLVVPLPPVRPGVKGQVKEVPCNTAYGSLGPKEVIVGLRAIRKLYEILMNVESNIRKAEDPNTRRGAWSSFAEIQLSLPAVIFSEALRFLVLREWVSTRLEAGDIDESQGTPVPEILTQDFNEWTTNSGPMFTEVPRPHQKFFAMLGIIKREASTVVPYMDPQHMEKDTSKRPKFDSKAKIHLNIVVIGHLNSGKSTTFGHLIHMKGCIDKCTMDKCVKEAAEMNKSSSRYAWLFDKLKSERERGMSIDIAVRRLESKKYVWTILDAPGHPDFIKNMIAGTSQADCSVLVVDSTSFEAGISDDGQIREHALLARVLGVKQMICCCNKMDATTPKYSKERYEEVKKEVSSCIKKFGYKPADIPFVHISGLEGDNMIERSVNMGWYKGLTLLEALDAVNVPQLPMGVIAMDKRPLRLPLRGDYEIGGLGTVSVGCVQTGVLKPRMKVTFAPTNLGGDVRSVELHHELVQMALPKDSVGLHTRGLVAGDLNRGYVVSKADLDPAQEAVSFKAHVWICHQFGEKWEIRKGYTPVMHYHTSQTAVKFVELVAKLDKKFAIVEHSPQCLKKGDIWLVKMVPIQPVVVEMYEQYPRLGRFVLRNSGKTVGYGIIMSVERKEPTVTAKRK